MTFGDYKREKCPHCGAEMKALAQSLYCPNDCDRIPQQELNTRETEPIRLRCPKCQSPDLTQIYFWTWSGHKMFRL